MPTKKVSSDYQTLRAELDNILASFEDPALDIDIALMQYERGITVIKELEHYLTEAKNTIKKITRATRDI